MYLHVFHTIEKQPEKLNINNSPFKNSVKYLSVLIFMRQNNSQYSSESPSLKVLKKYVDVEFSIIV